MHLCYNAYVSTMLEAVELSQSTVLFVQGNQKLGEAHHTDILKQRAIILIYGEYPQLICVRRWSVWEDQCAFPYLAVTAPEMCSERYSGLHHSCWGQKTNACLFVQFCKDFDQEALLNPADHITPHWKTMDFPLIASVGANFAYSCKSLHTFWSSRSADLLSQFHRVQFSTDYNAKVGSEEKCREKNYWACFKIDCNYI